jgi:hypothetical protein
VSTVDLVIEKVKGLPENQVAAVWAFIRELSERPALTAVELMRMSPVDRRRILSEQARQAETVYRQNPELMIDDTETPLNYG